MFRALAAALLQDCTSAAALLTSKAQLIVDNVGMVNVEVASLRRGLKPELV